MLKKSSLKPLFSIICIYALLVLGGGLSGYFLAHSKPSLCTGITSFILLLGSALAILKGKKWGFMGSLVIILILDGFFTFRYIQSQKFMPSGFMALLSLVTLLVLVFTVRKASSSK